MLLNKLSEITHSAPAIHKSSCFSMILFSIRSVNLTKKLVRSNYILYESPATLISRYHFFWNISRDHFFLSCNSRDHLGVGTHSVAMYTTAHTRTRIGVGLGLLSRASCLEKERKFYLTFQGFASNDVRVGRPN
jgi:hypothetical protein